MSIFGSIMGAIFGHGAQAKTAEITTTAAPGTASASTSPASTSAAPGTPAAQTVDVAAIVDKAAAATGEKLDWRTSIVDLMKLLDMDSSLTERKELAQELGVSHGTVRKALDALERMRTDKIGMALVMNHPSRVRARLEKVQQPALLGQELARAEQQGARRRLAVGVARPSADRARHDGVVRG